MALLLPELKDRLAREFDVVTLLEMLNIDSETLVELCSDLIEEKYDELVGKLDEDEWRA